MSTSDIFGFTLFVSFGLWWAVFPRSVVRFYTWFHKGKMKMPRLAAIRVIGAAWIVLVSVITLTAQKK
jgi:succinate-acetate transporter protein